MKNFIWWKEELRREDEKHPERAEQVAKNMKKYLDYIKKELINKI